MTTRGEWVQCNTPDGSSSRASRSARDCWRRGPRRRRPRSWRSQSTSHAVLNQLEALGLDVTYEGEDRTELMLHGPEDVQILADTGLATKVLIEDMDGANDARLANEDAHQKRGREGHRAALGAAHRPRRLPRPGDDQRRAPAARDDLPGQGQALHAEQDVAARQADLRRRGQRQRRAERRQAGLPAHRRPPRPRVADGRVHDGVHQRPADALRQRRRREDPARQGQADRGPGRQPGRLRPLAQPAERAEAQELPDHGRRHPDARGLHAGGERQPRHRPQPQLPAVLGRPGLEHERDGLQHARRGPGLRARDPGHDQPGQHEPDHGRDQQPHARPAPAARAELLQRARRRRRRGRLPGPARAALARTSRAGPPARGPTSTTRPPARPSSRPTTPTARSASRPRRRPASAARRRSTRRTRTSSTTTSAPARATPGRRCAASTTTRSRRRPSRRCTP